MNNSEFEVSLGAEIAPGTLANDMAKSAARVLANQNYPYARLLRVRRNREGTTETLVFEVDVERPQKRAAPIARTELISATFRSGRQPEVYALRDGFPSEAIHINLGGEGDPPWLSLEERSWDEVRARWTGLNFIERIRWWLSATARGDIQGDAQPAEPIFLSAITAIVPPELFGGTWDPNKTLNVVAVSTESNPNTIVLHEGSANSGPQGSQFVPIVVTANPLPMQRMRFAPTTVESLHKLLHDWGIDLVGALRREILDILDTRKPQLAARPLVFMPLLDANRTPAGATDVKAFTIGSEFDFAKLGEALGSLLVTPIIGKPPQVVLRIPANLGALGSSISISIVSVQMHLDRNSAARGSGLVADDRNTVLIGAGAIGSHLVDILRRDGFGKWTIIDDDAFLPHNAQRHRVAATLVGVPKARATAEMVNWAIGRGTETQFVIANVLRDTVRVEPSFKDAALIVDASASIPVSRRLADLEGIGAPRVSVFFNIAGRDVVLLGESRDRAIALDALEAQYYRFVVEREELAGHISEAAVKYQYAHACRSVSFKMPEHQVSMLSGAIAGELQRYVGDAGGTIAIWVGSDSGLRRYYFRPSKVIHHKIADWRIIMDEDVTSTFWHLREAHLPAETGGILLGTIDISRRQLCVVSVVEAPPDSFGDSAGFERGVAHLRAKVDAANMRTAGQVEYIGEWHSHPKGVAPIASKTDLTQLLWLAKEREIEDVPTLMVIVGDEGQYGLHVVESYW